MNLPPTCYPVWKNEFNKKKLCLLFKLVFLHLSFFCSNILKCSSLLISIFSAGERSAYFTGRNQSPPDKDHNTCPWTRNGHLIGIFCYTVLATPIFRLRMILVATNPWHFKFRCIFYFWCKDALK